MDAPAASDIADDAAALRRTRADGALNMVKRSRVVPELEQLEQRATQ